jgi:hypothetical protein
MWRMILKEQIRPAEQQDKLLIAKLYSQIQENIKLASALNLGTPVVAQIKAMVDKASNNNESNSLYYNMQDIQSSSSIQAGPKDPSLY